MEIANFFGIERILEGLYNYYTDNDCTSVLSKEIKSPSVKIWAVPNKLVQVE